MAASKSNRSVKNKQSALSIQHSAKAKSKTKKEQSTRPNQQSIKSSWLRKVLRFPQTKGKTIESTEFSTELGYHCISINFTDKTSLNFAIDASFTVETDYSDWKTGDQRLLRRWQPVQNLEFRDTLLTNRRKHRVPPALRCADSPRDDVRWKHISDTAVISSHVRRSVRLLPLI